jgi:hypothetical protein
LDDRDGLGGDEAVDEVQEIGTQTGKRKQNHQREEKDESRKDRQDQVIRESGGHLEDAILIYVAVGVGQSALETGERHGG